MNGDVGKKRNGIICSEKQLLMLFTVAHCCSTTLSAGVLTGVINISEIDDLNKKKVNSSCLTSHGDKKGSLALLYFSWVRVTYDYGADVCVFCWESCEQPFLLSFTVACFWQIAAALRHSTAVNHCSSSSSPGACLMRRCPLRRKTGSVSWAVLWEK